ncbi:hypothetical protein, partial [Arsenophonus sp.]|uniref:hypothetical protein n=1 Tax=Arsenophonus sp. TaxID=1872640 RepID=UPI0028568464
LIFVNSVNAGRCCSSEIAPMTGFLLFAWWFFRWNGLDRVCLIILPLQAAVVPLVPLQREIG